MIGIVRIAIPVQAQPLLLVGSSHVGGDHAVSGTCQGSPQSPQVPLVPCTKAISPLSLIAGCHCPHQPDAPAPALCVAQFPRQATHWRALRAPML